MWWQYPNPNYYYYPHAGYTCEFCNAWVPPNNWHTCPRVKPQTDKDVTRIADALERIAGVLERREAGE